MILADDMPSGESRHANGRRARTSGIDRVLQVLDHLQATGKPATGYDIARSLGAPLSTIYATIDDLVQKRMLARTNGNHVWLGPRLFHYGLAYARSIDLIGIATEEMRALAHEIGETVQICGRDGDNMVVLAMAEGAGHFHVASRVGTRVPLNWTASGRLLCGRLPRAELVALFRRIARPSRTGHAETDPVALADAAEQALRERVCVQVGESDFSVACVAAPILDLHGNCAATVSVVLPEEQVQRERDRFVAHVQAAARRIEERLGYRALDGALPIAG
jgi:DNA-binding IclR family transcriptional regulator